jgi:predicted dehydrogenase
MGYYDAYSYLRQHAPNFVFVCTPTDSHLLYTLAAIDLNIPVFLEKPISSSKEEFRNFKKRYNNEIIYVAYPFRFHPLIRMVKDTYNQETLVSACHTSVDKWAKPYSYSRKTGGGAILELSHQIDIVYYITGRIDSLSLVYQRLRDDIDILSILDFDGHEVLLSLDSPCEEKSITVGDRKFIYEISNKEYEAQIVFFLANPRAASNFKELAILHEHINNYSI